VKANPTEKTATSQVGVKRGKQQALKDRSIVSLALCLSSLGTVDLNKPKVNILYAIPLV
jgi:hypothetical protein